MNGPVFNVNYLRFQFIHLKFVRNSEISILLTYNFVFNLIFRIKSFAKMLIKISISPKRFFTKVNEPIAFINLKHVSLLTFCLIKQHHAESLNILLGHNRELFFFLVCDKLFSDSRLISIVHDFVLIWLDVFIYCRYGCISLFPVNIMIIVIFGLALNRACVLNGHILVGICYNEWLIWLFSNNFNAFSIC